MLMFLSDRCQTSSTKECLSRILNLPWKLLLKKSINPIEKSLRWVVLLLLGAYRTILTTHLGGSCRFYPSCSEYAVESFRTLPLHKAFYFVTRRVCSCRPGGPCGYDPVPNFYSAPSGLKGNSHAGK